MTAYRSEYICPQNNKNGHFLRNINKGEIIFKARTFCNIMIFGIIIAREISCTSAKEDEKYSFFISPLLMFHGILDFADTFTREGN